MTNAPSDSPQQQKSCLRDAALARRDALEIDDRLEWDPAITERVLAVLSGSDRIAPHGPVSAYWPMRSEADPRPVLEVLHARDFSLCLPAIVDKRMIFRRWAPWEPIVPGGFGTLVPEPQQATTGRSRRTPAASRRARSVSAGRSAPREVKTRMMSGIT